MANEIRHIETDRRRRRGIIRESYSLLYLYEVDPVIEGVGGTIAPTPGDELPASLKTGGTKVVTAAEVTELTAGELIAEEVRFDRRVGESAAAALARAQANYASRKAATLARYRAQYADTGKSYNATGGGA